MSPSQLRPMGLVGVRDCRECLIILHFFLLLTRVSVFLQMRRRASEMGENPERVPRERLWPRKLVVNTATTRK